jgi:hypothetical protein
MRSNFIFNISALLILLCSSCQGDDSVTTEPNPSNLTLAIVVSDDRSGSIEVIATADNTLEYAFYNGENTDDPIINTTGVFNYTYSITGIYTIEIRAYNAIGKFIKKESQINIQVGPDEGPIDGENGYITPLSYVGYALIWQDEFNGINLNESDWNYEINGNGGGNNELQYYRKENTSVSDGFLIIEAKKESFSGKSYTSSRLTTQNKFDFKFGRVDIRATLPKGQGIWPALWMLGSNFPSVGWPKCGEIDIMELIGGTGNDNTVYGTIHWDNNGTNACTCEQNNDYSLTTGIFADEFHVFSIIWDANSIHWFVDDIPFKTVDISQPDFREFQNIFFFIFNVAVGGNWPGSPDSSTLFPQKMIVDYIRVFQTN